MITRNAPEELALYQRLYSAVRDRADQPDMPIVRYFVGLVLDTSNEPEMDVPAPLASALPYNALLPRAASCEPFNMNMCDVVRYLHVQAINDLVMSGRPSRIHDLSATMFDDPDRREQIRRWPTRGVGKIPFIKETLLKQPR
jgi:hypothetical protein